MEAQDVDPYLQEFEEMKKRLKALEEENRDLQLQQTQNNNEVDVGRRIFSIMGKDELMKKERAILMVRSNFEKVEAEYKSLKKKCGPSSLFLKKNTIEDIEKLKIKYGSTILRRNIGTAGNVATLVARFGAYLKEADPAVKLALIGASMLCSNYVNQQRSELRRLSVEMGDLLSADFERYQSFVKAAEALDDALRRLFGLSLYSMEFRRLCYVVSSASGEIAEDRKVIEFMQSLSQNLQEKLKNLTQNDKLTDILRQLAEDNLLTNIRTAVSQNYVSMFFRFLPDLLDKFEPEVFLVPAQLFCEAILFCHENKVDKALLGEVDDNIERMKKELTVMLELCDCCKAIKT